VTGIVHLVGAGPGDPGLLTVRAVELIGEADVVLYDRLIPREALAHARPDAELVYVGKQGDGPQVPQDDTHRLLLEHARAGKRVVRLKGGDPFVFGRGGEEALAVRAAGLDVVVVPGISSSIAAPAVAGIPVTMRGAASGFTIITGHQDPHSERLLDWDALATAGTTLVILMGAARAAQIADRLIAGGMRADMPVAVVTSACCDGEEISRLTLDRLGREPVRNPATIVIGEVAAHDVLRDVVTDVAHASTLAASAPVSKGALP
jgi:uroporphyrin-III C-methyltransferase